jgi:hypothetical protein
VNLRISLGVLVLSAFLAVPATAQTCLSAPTLASGRTTNLSAGASFFDGGKTYSVSTNMGSTWFGGGAFAFTDYDNTDLSWKTIAGQAGVQIENHYCPIERNPDEPVPNRLWGWGEEGWR